LSEESKKIVTNLHIVPTESILRAETEALQAVHLIMPSKIEEHDFHMQRQLD
jgi:hypothetical protein